MCVCTRQEEHSYISRDRHFKFSDGPRIDGKEVRRQEINTTAKIVFYFFHTLLVRTVLALSVKTVAGTQLPEIEMIFPILREKGIFVRKIYSKNLGCREKVFPLFLPISELTGDIQCCSMCVRSLLTEL